MPTVPPVQSPEFPSKVDTIVVGSIALDTMSKVNDDHHLHDSNPASTKSSIGGVGFNVSLACKYGLANSKASSRLVSVVGNDHAGESIISGLVSQNIDTSGILIDPTNNQRTAQYTSIHDEKGELIIACADMLIIEQEVVIKHVKKELTRGQPSTVVLDCNLSSKTLTEILDHCQTSLPKALVVIEPTSLVKAERISQINSQKLSVYPRNPIKLITPTVNELEAIYSSFQAREFFDDYNEWFPVVDQLGINEIFRNRLASHKNKFIQNAVTQGYFQQCLKLLPFFQNILLKCGKDGVLMVSIIENIEDIKSIPTTSKYAPTAIITSRGKNLGALIEYFDIPVENQNLDIVNVTGAGDSFLGYLTSRLAQSPIILDSKINSIEQIWEKWEVIYKSQLASGLSIGESNAISSKIKKL